MLIKTRNFCVQTGLDLTISINLSPTFTLSGVDRKSSGI